MSQRLFAAASCAWLALAVPASAQRVITRIPVPGGNMPLVFPAGRISLPPAPGPSLSAPSLSLALGAPAPAFAPATPVVAAAVAAPVLALSLRPAAAAQTPNHEQAAKIAAPLDALHNAALGADGNELGDQGSGRIFDGSDPMRRPLVEGWRVEGKEYASTRDLVLGLPNGEAPVAATYRFAHSDKPVPPARAANTGVGFVAGGAVGALLGTAFLFVGSILNEVLGGRGVDPAQLGLFAGTAGAFGAFIGALIGFEESGRPADPRENISGSIYRHTGPQGETLYFAAERYGRKILVDLGAYAFAMPLAEPAAPAPWPVWKRAVVGLAAGAALAVSQWVPLLQILALPLAGPAVGAGIGHALSAGKGIAGGLLGASLGLLVPAAAFLSFAAVGSVGILMSFGAFAGVFAALGLIVGLVAANAVRADAAREEAHNPAGQWWSAAKDK